MSMAPVSILALAACVAANPLAARGPDGINNKGSGNCWKGSMSKIKEYISNAPDTQIYHPEFHLACSDIVRPGSTGGGTCAFLQKGAGPLTGKQIKELITLLANHPNTEGCGSVPVSLLPEYGSINELDKMGMLTVNYVRDTDNPCPPGLCDGTPAPTKPTKPKPQPICAVGEPDRHAQSPSRIYAREPISWNAAAKVGQDMLLENGQLLGITRITETATPLSGFNALSTDYQNLLPGLARGMSRAVYDEGRFMEQCGSKTALVAWQSGSDQVLNEAQWGIVLGSALEYVRSKRGRVQGVTLFMVAGAAQFIVEFGAGLR